MSALRRFVFVGCFVLLSAPAIAQDREVPYWASIRVEKVNMRVGPSTAYQIAWVYKREQLPVKVLRREEGWRLIEDPEGARGWVLGRFLSLERTAIVTGEGLVEMRESAGGSSPLLWRLEPGVMGKLGNCNAGWCRLSVGGHAGYAPQKRLWGASEL